MHLKKKLKYLVLIRRLPCKSSGKRLTRKSSLITKVSPESRNKILEDLCVSRLPGDLHESHLIIIKYLTFIFQLQKLLEKTFTNSEKIFMESSEDLQGSLPPKDFRVSHLEKVKLLTQSGQLQN